MASIREMDPMIMDYIPDNIDDAIEVIRQSVHERESLLTCSTKWSNLMKDRIPEQQDRIDKLKRLGLMLIKKARVIGLIGNGDAECKKKLWDMLLVLNLMEVSYREYFCEMREKDMNPRYHARRELEEIINQKHRCREELLPLIAEAVSRHFWLENEDWESDQRIWSRDLEKHFYGEFSFSVVQANAPMQDFSQIDSRKNTTFVGVYEGHGGTDAAEHVCENLFNNLLKFAREIKTVDDPVIQSAFAKTEEDFLELVKGDLGTRPKVATIGSCVLVGVIWKGIIFVANLGDCRAVLGLSEDGESDKIVAQQLTRDHNARLQALHPEDSEIVVEKKGCYRVKGILQVTRAIGDAYMKKPEFAMSHFPSFPRPFLSAVPDVIHRDIQASDQFIIFATNGLWDYVSNKEAVEIVQNNPREGIAKRLVITAIKKAASRHRIACDGVKKLTIHNRRDVHDDISIVLFIDHRRLQLDEENSADVPKRIHVPGFVGPSVPAFGSSTLVVPSHLLVPYYNKISGDEFP